MHIQELLHTLIHAPKVLLDGHWYALLGETLYRGPLLGGVSLDVLQRTELADEWALPEADQVECARAREALDALQLPVYLLDWAEGYEPKKQAVTLGFFTHANGFGRQTRELYAEMTVGEERDASDLTGKLTVRRIS